MHCQFTRCGYFFMQTLPDEHGRLANIWKHVMSNMKKNTPFFFLIVNRFETWVNTITLLLYDIVKKIILFLFLPCERDTVIVMLTPKPAGINIHKMKATLNVSSSSSFLFFNFTFMAKS